MGNVTGNHQQDIKEKILETIMQDVIKEFLTTPKNIAVVGLSPSPTKTSTEIALFLASNGHNILPVHPILGELLGKLTYKSIEELPTNTDGLLIYMTQRNVDKFVEKAINKHIPLIWLPLNITSTLKSRAEKEGIIFIENRCPKIEWKRLQL